MTSAIRNALNLPSTNINLDDEEDEVTVSSSDYELRQSMQGHEDMFSGIQTEDATMAEYDKEMDTIATVAMTRHETFADLAVNVDPKQAEAFVAGASQMLTIALNAKKEKMDKRLRIEKLKLDRERLDMQRGQSTEGVIEGEGTLLMDRNDILSRWLDDANEKNDGK